MGATLPRWSPPSDAAGPLRLRVSNSLCGEKVEFVPAKGGRQVTWYICGPTVYDSSHVGHARNYVTFDIIRRILEEFFGYDVFYVMNVTDVDDKIINRARRMHLLQKYAESQKSAEQVFKDAASALGEEIDKQEKKLKGVEADTLAATTSRQREDLANALAQEKLKLEKLQAAAAVLSKERESLLDPSKSAKEALAGILAIAADAIASSLDAKEGASVTDLAIFRSHAAKYEQEFFEDMQALGMRPPDVICRVTESMPVIKDYVQKIVDNGFAYLSQGSVYFDTAAFKKAGHFYGKLCPWAVGQSTLAAESEANFETKEKRDPNDFALWKASRPGEPSWESPWGKGRPGWHIECSAMASDIIGDVLDLHSGGCDLRFPHHDNELAQAEAYFCNSQWCNYFLHSGHLHIDGLKMSKSLKNFITVRQALEDWSPRQLRLLFLLQPWDKPMNYGVSSMAEVQSKEKQLTNFFQNVQVYLRKTQSMTSSSPGSSLRLETTWNQPERELRRRLLACQQAVEERLADNFDTSGAIQALLDVVNGVNSYVAKVEDELSLLPAEVGGRGTGVVLLRSVVSYVTRILSIFGLCDRRGGWLEVAAGVASSQSDRESVLGPYLDVFAAFRDEVRAAARLGDGGGGKEMILSACDRVRDESLIDIGVKLEDKPGGQSVWKLDDPSVLKKERERERRERLQAPIKKLDRKIASKKQELEKWECAAVPPTQFFLSDEKRKNFSAFDAQGIPTHDAAGKGLSGKARKNAEKEASKVRDLHAQYAKKVQENPGFLEDVRRELKGMQDELSRLQAAAGE
ncbi:hypothetical protein CBR_g41622 [Chara braunii]|uniref:cysteine--tRNA ligase n=1 Tax=Chara braunii TaxID=69332 RepID=A0A388LWG8_CHABU|nr:hypothetical protein CBR_g41622 [Chara braunii]|eukprot:GBG86559.1 hypothetical protein CBR_g41622 [Chara braunii]